MTLIQMSISGAMMIVIIAVIRVFTINRLPKEAFLILWGLCVMRLLIPFTVFSPISIFSLLSGLKPDISNVVANNGNSVAWAFGNLITSANNTIASGESSFFTKENVCLVAWIAGGIACAVFFIISNLRCRKIFVQSIPVDNEITRSWLSSNNFHRCIDIRCSDRISAPLTYGVFRPVILLPKAIDWSDENCLQYVLTHEREHIRRFDALIKLLLLCAVCIHWFNPAAWLMLHIANMDIELSCDEAVLKIFGKNAKTDYAMTLIQLEEKRGGLRPLCNSFSKNAIESRIIAIMNCKKLSLMTLLITAVLIVGVPTFFATSANATNKTVSNTDNELTDEELPVKEYTLIEEAVYSGYVNNGSENHKNCNASLAFNENSWGVTATADCDRTVGSIFITITYTYFDPETDLAHTITKSISNADCKSLTFSLEPEGACSGNISASCSASIAAKNGAVWNSPVISINADK